MKETIVTLTGPSCAGKSTLASQLVKLGMFTEIISTTTRSPRAGEVNGKHYHFVTPEEFARIPMMETVEFSGKKYGGSVAEFERHFASGKIPVIVVEPNGANQIQKEALNRGWNHLKVFVDCPLDILIQRNLSRLLAEPDQREAVKVYGRRFANLITDELTWMHRSVWDMIIPEFLPENEKEHRDEVVRQAKLLRGA